MDDDIEAAEQGACHGFQRSMLYMVGETDMIQRHMSLRDPFKQIHFIHR